MSLIIAPEHYHSQRSFLVTVGGTILVALAAVLALAPIILHWHFDLGQLAVMLWLIGIVMQITGGLTLFGTLRRRRPHH